MPHRARTPRPADPRQAGYTHTRTALTRHLALDSILLQTALLHPVPELREGAIVTILGCVQRDDGADSAFVAEALDQQLPVALVRLCTAQCQGVGAWAAAAATMAGRLAALSSSAHVC